MILLRSVANRFRTILDRIGGLFEETRVARFMTVAGSAGGFTVPDPDSPLPQSDLQIQDIHAPGLVPETSPVIFSGRAT